MGGSGLDRTDDFQKFCGLSTGSDSILSDQDWTRTEKFPSLLISGEYLYVCCVMCEWFSVRLSP